MNDYRPPTSSKTDDEKPEENCGELNDNIVNNGEEEDDDEAYTYATQIAESLSLPMVMRTAVELDLLGIMSRAGPGRRLSAAEIAAEIPGVRNPDAPEMLDRMLYLLATYSVVTCTAVDGGGVERRYGLSAVGKYFVADENGASLSPVVLLNLHEAYLLGWSKLKEVVLEGGIAFHKFHGMNEFEYSGTDPTFNEIFNKAMRGLSIPPIKNIVRRYKGFDNIHKLVDVGGGLGHTLKVITRNYPSIKGINYDLPHVIQHAPPIQESAQLQAIQRANLRGSPVLSIFIFNLVLKLRDLQFSAQIRVVPHIPGHIRVNPSKIATGSA